MTERILPGIGLTGYWDQGAPWKVGGDQNWLKSSVLTQLAVESATTSLPASPLNGVIYIVPAADTNANQVAARDNGAWVFMPPQEGWTAYVRDTGVLMNYDGAAWAPSTAPFASALAAASTVAIGGFSIAETQSILDNALPMQDYTALRAYTGRALGVKITTPGVDGVFWRDAADTTSSDNGGTIIVDASGRRWKRLLSGVIYVDWFGAAGNGVADDYAAAQATINFAQDKYLILFTSGKTYKISQPLLCPYRVSIRSTSVGSVLGTATIDGVGLANNQFCLYLQQTYSAVRGITFSGDSRRVSGINCGVTPLGAVSHASTIEDCNFPSCYIGIDNNFTCDVLVNRCYFNACYIGVRLDNTANTWDIKDCLFFNFLAATSYCCIHVKWADQLKIEGMWSELNSVPAVIAEKYTNLVMTACWLEHLVVGNAQPLLIANSSATARSDNFVVENSDFLVDYNPVVQVLNANNAYFRNIRIDGLKVPTNIYPIFDATGTNFIELEGVLQGFINQPATNIDSVIVNGALRVRRDSVSDTLVKKAYTNQVWDSSFKGLSNVAAAVGDATFSQDTATGVYDSNSLKVAFGAAGTGKVRTANSITVAVGDYVRISVRMKTTATTRHETVKVRFAGPGGGVVQTLALTDDWREYEIGWQVTTGNNGANFVWFEASQTGAYNVWVDDVQAITDSTASVPYTPYAMNNSLTAAVKIGVGVNITEHNLMGRRVTSAVAAPTTGSWAKGDIVYNDSVAASGNIGWVCVTAGTPGTWKTFGAIAA